jgi:threonyl-tRNA synthetase
MSQTANIKITLPDGSLFESTKGSTPREVAERIGPRLAKAALVAQTDGRLIDLSHPLEGDTTLSTLTERDPEALDVYRHSSAHLMA